MYEQSWITLVTLIAWAVIDHCCHSNYMGVFIIKQQMFMLMLLLLFLFFKQGFPQVCPTWSIRS